MAVSLIGGAALGAVFGELLRVVVQETTQIANFKSLLKRLKKTLTSIKPLFDDITELNKMLEDRPERDTAVFTNYLKDGTELVRRCSDIRWWNAYDKLTYSKKLIRLDNELLRFFHMETQAMTLSYSMRTLIGIHDLTDKVDRQFSARFSIPGIPEFIIGFDRHLEDVKCRLLKDEAPQVLVLSGPGGCGKTTLAKMLCHDLQIKDIFGDNILYIIVSRGSNLRTIAKKLFEHHGRSNYEFQTDEEAKNGIESLLQLRGSSDNMLLLVLDDVWPGSESLVQDLKFPIPGYKILVTSRSLLRMFNNTYELSLLNEKEANTLFRYYAFPNKIPVNVPEDLVNKIVEFCKGLPLALTIVGASLCGQPVVKWKSTLKKWSEGQSILLSNSSLLDRLRTSIDALDDLPIVKECFLNFGSFPEDDRIEGTTLEDMWVELYNLDDEGMYASENLLELASRNLVNVVPIRKYSGEVEGYCNDYYVMQHDLLRDLAIHLSKQGPIGQRKQSFIEIHGNSFPTWWVEQTEQPISTRILSISTDEAFSSNWHDLNAPNVEVLKLNIRSKEYDMPWFIQRMSQLKVLIVTGYGDSPVQLHNLQFIGSLCNLRRIRFEHISLSPSIQFIFKLQSLRKLTFVTCEIGDALKIGTTDNESPYMLPNLSCLEINRCYDLKELPAEICSLVGLQKLIITNCQELDALPEGLGNLSNLNILMLHCCTKLRELPESIGRLQHLSLVDISDCLSIRVLPEQIGELSCLREVNMSGCQGLEELPVSMSKLLHLKDVICDEEISHLWKNCGSDLPNVKIHLVEEDRFATFMKIGQ